MGLEDEAQEREIEKALVGHLRDFLLELGVGFAFVGNQHRLEVGGDEFFIDMLFYHLRLRCYVVVELKAVPFKPEYAGKLNFYLSAVDDLLRHPDDAPTIGLLLCRGKNKVVAEYALRGMTRPMGVSEYQLSSALPEALRGKLPTVAELEAELEAADGGQEGDEGTDSVYHGRCPSTMGSAQVQGDAGCDGQPLTSPLERSATSRTPAMHPGQNADPPRSAGSWRP